jgi:hypothetical protein
MSNAGQLSLAGRIPGERIATTVVTADSAGFTTTEVSVASVTAELVSGRTYRLRAVPKWESDVADDRINARLREDDAVGTIMQSDNVRILVVSALGWGGVMEVEYTATATADKTFVLTGQRAGGTGTCKLGAGATRPVYLYVDYVSG